MALVFSSHILPTIWHWTEHTNTKTTFLVFHVIKNDCQRNEDVTLQEEKNEESLLTAVFKPLQGSPRGGKGYQMSEALKKSDLRVCV